MAANVDLTYDLDVEPDDLDIRGNASAIDDETDRETEDAIFARLENGDVWAWAVVTVRATLTIDDETFTGRAVLGGCSYADEADFCQPGGYYDDLQAEALDDLTANVRHDLMRCKGARKALRWLEVQ
jgi:hypothetical protein